MANIVPTEIVFSIWTVKKKCRRLKNVLDVTKIIRDSEDNLCFYSY
jgi:hypothetical protein